MNKPDLIDYLVRDFRTTMPNASTGEVMRLKMMLNGLEISDLETLKNEAEKQSAEYKPTEIRFLK